MVFVSLSCLVPALRPWLGGGGGGSPGDSLYLIALGLVIPGGLYGIMGSLRTQVTSEAVVLSWGMAHLVKKVVPFEEITGMEPVTYRPLAEFGGWGIRMSGKGKRAWTVSGTQALVLTLKNGTRLYLGSQHPSRLEERIRSGMSIRKAGEKA